VSLPVRILERDGSCRQGLSFGGLSPEFYGGDSLNLDGGSGIFEG
jgi:hypothetical protein